MAEISIPTLGGTPGQAPGTVITGYDKYRGYQNTYFLDQMAEWTLLIRDAESL